MSKEKQIEEMANDLAQHCPDLVENCCGASSCVSCLTRFLYTAGYRKQSEDVTDINVGCKSEWVSVEERLPEPQKLVLCIWKRADDGWNYGFARYQREDVWYVSNEGMPRVTHWMPLPEAPKGGAE